MMTDRQLFATLKAESKAKTPVTSSSIKETTPYIAGALDALNTPSAPLSMDLVYNLDRMAFGFSVERLGKGDYQITPSLSFKYAPPAGEAPFGKDFLSPSVIKVNNDTTMTRELGLCTVRERGKKFSPFAEDSVGTVVRELKKEGKAECIDPVHGGLSNEYLRHNAGLTMQAILDEVTSYVGLQINLPTISSKEVEGLRGIELAHRVKTEAVKCLAPLVWKAIGRVGSQEHIESELDRIINQEFLLNHSSSSTDLGATCESLAGENWGTKRSKGWKVKPEKECFRNLGNSLSELCSKIGPAPEKGVMNVIKNLCVVRSLYGDREYSMESTSPRRADGTPVWPDRMTFPVSLSNVRVDWVSDPTRNGNKFSPRHNQWEVAMILACDPSGTSTATEEKPPVTTEEPPPVTTKEKPPVTTEEPPPVTTKEKPPVTTEEAPPVTTEERAPSTSTPQGDKPLNPFPSMKDWKDVLTIKIH